MREDLEARAEELAEKAECSRCGAVIMEEPSALGVSGVSVRGLATGLVNHFTLCGMCGLAVREFLMPALATDSVFQKLKASLMMVWAK